MQICSGSCESMQIFPHIYEYKILDEMRAVVMRDGGSLTRERLHNPTIVSGLLF